MWGLVVSAVTIGASFLGKTKDGSTSSSTSESTQLIIAKNGSDRNFLSGMVLGMGLSLVYATVMQEFRFMERARLIWNTWLWDEKKKAPLRLPVSVADTADVFVSQMSEFGSVRVLVSPAVAATSFLHVSLLTLQPECEIAPCKSRSVEFYYVMSGSGLFSQQGVVETSRLSAGDGFVVDPGSMRWISNSKGTEALILLRASDGGSFYSKRNFDPIRLDPNRKASTLDLLKDGYEKVKVFGKAYTTTSSM